MAGEVGSGGGERGICGEGWGVYADMGEGEIGRGERCIYGGGREGYKLRGERCIC